MHFNERSRWFPASRCHCTRKTWIIEQRAAAGLSTARSLRVPFPLVDDAYRLGHLGGDYAYSASATALSVGSSLLNNYTRGFHYTPPNISSPTGRLQFHASLAQNLPAFTEDPKNDAEDGEYRLYIKLRICFSCCKGKLSNLKITGGRVESGSRLRSLTDAERNRRLRTRLNRGQIQSARRPAKR